MAAVTLPAFIVLKSMPTGKYLQCLKDGKVQFSGENVWSPEAKFQVERSKSGNGLVHIRSVYNNKYLTLSANNCIVATAAEKVEDHTKPSCTLLKPTSVNGDRTKIRLTSVHCGKNVCNLSSNSSSNDVFNVVDWESLVILPKYVNFKGDNNKYLKNHGQDGHEFLRFFTNDVAENPASTGHEIFPNPDGTIRIKNIQTGKFWRGTPGWIWVDYATANNMDSVFEPIKLSHNTIALRSLGNNRFCTRLTTEGKESCLHANADVINQWAKMVVSEHIVSRKASNFNFRVMDSRIYNEHILYMSSVVVKNTTQNKHQQTVDLKHTDTKSSTWNSMLSLKLGFQVSYNVGLPLIFEGTVGLSGEVAGQYAWGEQVTTTTEMQCQYTACVPAGTKVTVRIIATEATCDVPFSYTQRDLLYDGKTVVTEIDGCVYTGINSYNKYIEVKEEPLTNTNNGSSVAEFNRVANVSPDCRIMNNGSNFVAASPYSMGGLKGKSLGNTYGSSVAEFKRVAKVLPDGRIINT